MLDTCIQAHFSFFCVIYICVCIRIKVCVCVCIYIYIYIYIYIDQLIGLVGRVFANGPEDLGSIPGRVIP